MAELSIFLTSGSGDDAEYYINSFNESRNYHWIGSHSVDSFGPWTGLKFAYDDITVSSSDITSVVLRFSIVNSGYIYSYIRVEQSAAVAFADTVAGRPKERWSAIGSTNEVHWTSGYLTGGANRHTTPDFSTAFKTALDNLTSGDDIGIMFGIDTASGVNVQQMYSSDYTTDSYRPELVITYNASTTIAPNDISLSLTEDATTVAETNFIIAPNDISLVLTEDADTIAQNHVIQPQDIAFSLVEDNTTLDQIHVITPQDISLPLVEDNSVLYQDHVIASADVSLPLTTDNTTILQNHIITPQDVSIVLTEDNTSVSEDSVNYTIVTQDISLPLTTDNTSLVENLTIVSQDISLVSTIDNATITQNHIISPSDIAFSLIEDNTSISQNHVVQTQDISIALTEDNTTVAETNIIIKPQDITLPLTEDTGTISQNYIIASQDISLVLTTDNATIVPIATDYIISPVGVTFGSSDSAPKVLFDIEQGSFYIRTGSIIRKL